MPSSSPPHGNPTLRPGSGSYSALPVGALAGLAASVHSASILLYVQNLNSVMKVELIQNKSSEEIGKVS